MVSVFGSVTLEAGSEMRRFTKMLTQFTPLFINHLPTEDLCEYISMYGVAHYKVFPLYAEIKKGVIIVDMDINATHW